MYITFIINFITMIFKYLYLDILIYSILYKIFIKFLFFKLN